MTAPANRPYDVVLFGATGFTGGLVAEYLARASTRESFRWAVAGRSPEKLDEVRRRIAAIAPEAKVGSLIADVDDRDALAAMAGSTAVLITTVGPYLRYGNDVLAACVEAGTHYVDLTGEPGFVDRSRKLYDDIARQRGLRIVHCCGFDSIPHDLGALFAVDALRERIGEDAFNEADITVRGFVEASGTFSGGTWNSAIEQFSRGRQYLKERPKLDRDAVRTVRGERARLYYDRALRRWACPLPTIDPQVVLQSARLRADYGATFRYGHYLLSDHLLPIIGGAVGIGTVMALAQFKPTADLLRKVRQGGEGPSAEKRAASWFRVLFIAGDGKHEVTCEVSGGDPGYDETAKMLAESALAIALDADLPPHCGVVTPAAGIGHTLIRRLQVAGIRFSVVR
ncbi:MAG: saccharopine dehydrogenase family protein [Gammaproteobacteria bacterium]